MRLQSASVVVTVAVLTGCGYYHRLPQLNPTPLPVDLSYSAEGRFVMLRIDPDRVVQYSVGGEMLWAKVPQASIDQLTAHIGSQAFREFLRKARRTTRKTHLVSEGTLYLYSRGWGHACGLDEKGRWVSREIRGYPPYLVSTHAGSVAPVVRTLVEIVNYVGRTAFAERFLSIEVGAIGPEPNTRVNATVRPVTALANSASAAPVRPARYAQRSADNRE